MLGFLINNPTVGVPFFGPKVSDRLSSPKQVSSEEPEVRMKILLAYSFFRTGALKCWSGGAKYNLPIMASGEGLTNFWCTPTVG